MNSFNENNLIDKNFPGFEDINKMVNTEQKLLGSQRESFSNTRNLIIAAATISSVDLLAFGALEKLNLGTWFLLSVLFLYISCVLFSIYLTSSNNFQVKRISEDNNLFSDIQNLLKDPELNNFSKMNPVFEDYLKKIEKRVKFSKNYGSLFMVGNISFIVGLVIPIIGLMVYIIKTL